jgi:hypothetical protein
MFTVAASALIAGAAPATALAHHHHHRHHHHARIRHFGDQNAPASSMSSADNAGKVMSFSGGVLTIVLNDNTTTVKGMVTDATELECAAPEESATTMHDDGDRGSGDQGSGDDNQGSGGDDQGDNDQNEVENENENEASCTTASLKPGTVVHEAALRIGSSGPTWQKVELVF